MIAVDTIRILPGQLTDSLNLRSNSALADCTQVGGDAAGVYFEKRWPGLSTGEDILWSLLAWLNGARDCPTVAELQAGLDDANQCAALDALDAGLGIAVTR